MFVQLLTLAVMVQPTPSQGPYVRSVNLATVKSAGVSDAKLLLDIGGTLVWTTPSSVLKSWQIQAIFLPALLQPPEPQIRRVWECGVLGQTFFIIWVDNEPVLGLKRPSRVELAEGMVTLYLSRLA